eukprot:TRINITY_DN19227_c1_g3_i3.p1 TRINITY_DN19227_c1_g3~~TRINITY_DN19227_c1_g3_i3.p1  ORF type:complete len:562 (-),score=72.92 TRINITY_DN19227_c1_g3_i3:191-1876(-)
MCVAENLGLQECAPVEQQKKPNMYQSFRMAMNGEACEFPFEFNGKMYDDCVDVVGSKMCVANGMLQECEPVANRTQRTTVDGEKCIFPFDLLGSKHYDCTDINGVQACLIGGGFAQCSPQNQQKQTNNTRFTIDGRECQFPFNFMDEEYYDCNEFLGEEWCMMEGEEWVKCLPDNNNEDDNDNKADDNGDLTKNTEMIGSVINQISSQVHANSYSSIVDACGDISELSVLMQSFLLSNLAPFLSNPGLEVTLFAPTNEAFYSFLKSRQISTEDIMNHPEEFYQLFLYHIVPETIKYEDLFNGQILSTLQDQYQLTVDVSLDEEVEVIGIHSIANITTQNIKAGAAIIHIVDTILVPFEFSPSSLSQDQPNRTISGKDSLVSYKHLQNDNSQLEELSIFMELAEIAQIDEIVRGDLDGMTLLAPSNAAFQTFFNSQNSTFEELAKQDDLSLKTLIQYHSIPLYLSSHDLSRKLVIPTLLDEKMLLLTHSSQQPQQQQNSITVRGIGSSARISTSGVQLGQGIIYVLDGVLWPYNQPDDLNQEDSSQDQLQQRMFQSIKTLLN